MLSVKLQPSSSMGQPLYWKTGKIFHVLFTITATNVNTPGNANPYVAGGDTLDLTQLFSLLSSAPGNSLPTFETVAKCEVASFRPAGGASSANLFLYSFAPGTTLANGTLQVYTGAAAQTAPTELSAGNYPAGVLNDVIQGELMVVMP